MKISSIFTVTDIKTGQQSEVDVSGAGQETIAFLKRQYVPLTKFVLEGFKIDGKFKAVDLYSRY